LPSSADISIGWRTALRWRLNACGQAEPVTPSSPPIAYSPRRRRGVSLRQFWQRQAIALLGGSAGDASGAFGPATVRALYIRRLFARPAGVASSAPEPALSR
jgi:hypothetical protein